LQQSLGWSEIAMNAENNQKIEETAENNPDANVSIEDRIDTRDRVPSKSTEDDMEQLSRYHFVWFACNGDRGHIRHVRDFLPACLVLFSVKVDELHSV